MGYADNNWIRVTSDGIRIEWLDGMNEIGDALLSVLSLSFQAFRAWIIFRCPAIFARSSVADQQRTFRCEKWTVANSNEKINK